MVQVGFTVQAPYPPAVHHLVVSGQYLGRLLSPEGGAVTGLRICPLVRGQVLGLTPEQLHRLHILVGLELIPAWGRTRWHTVRDQTMARGVHRTEFSITLFMSVSYAVNCVCSWKILLLEWLGVYSQQRQVL